MPIVWNSTEKEKQNRFVPVCPRDGSPFVPRTCPLCPRNGPRSFWTPSGPKCLCLLNFFVRQWSGQSQLQNDRFFGRIFWTDFWTDFGLEFEVKKPHPTAIPTTNLGRNCCWHFHSIFSGFSAISKPTPTLHLRMVAGWSSRSPPFEPDPCPQHARVTSCIPPNLNLHNVPRALLPSVSLTLSLYLLYLVYLCVFLFVFWHELDHSCAREMVNADQTVHQLLKGGLFMGAGWGLWGARSKQMLFYNADFHLESTFAKMQRWQRESGRLARIDSQKNTYFHNVRAIRTNRLKPAIRDF